MKNYSWKEEHEKPRAWSRETSSPRPETTGNPPPAPPSPTAPKRKNPVSRGLLLIIAVSAVGAFIYARSKRGETAPIPRVSPVQPAPAAPAPAPAPAPEKPQPKTPVVKREAPSPSPKPEKPQPERKDSAANIRLLQEADKALENGNIELAYRKLKEAANAGSNTARLALGVWLLSGEHGISDPALAVKYLRTAADDGCVKAQYVYGKLLLFGEKVEGSPTLARKYLTMAANAKDEDAQTLLKLLDYLEACDKNGGQDENGYFFGPRSSNGLPCFAGSKGPYREAFLKWSERELHRRNMANNPMGGVSDTFRWLKDMEASTGLKYVFEMARAKEKELGAPLWVNPEFQRLVDNDQKAEDTRLKVFEVYYLREMERLRLERERIERERARHRYRHNR